MVCSTAFMVNLDTGLTGLKWLLKVIYMVKLINLI